MSSCSICLCPEQRKRSDGEINFPVNKEAKASICSRCVQWLLFQKIPNIPWDGKLPDKSENSNSETIITRRTRRAR